MTQAKQTVEPTGLATLQNSSLFRGLSPEELAIIVQAAKPHEWQSGEPLFYQEDSATRIFMLVHGQVKLLQNTPDGQQVLLRIIGPGEVIGIVAALEDSVYPATAQAAEPCSGLQWDGKALRRLMETYPRIALNVIPFLVSRVHELQDRFRELATERVERRVARLLLRLVRQAGKKVPGGVQIDMALTQQDLAEMTGTTLYTVSRILSHWEDQGLVKTGRKKVLICAPHKLVTIAEELSARRPD